MGHRNNPYASRCCATGSPSSSCEVIILRNMSHGEIIRVCKGIFSVKTFKTRTAQFVSFLTIFVSDHVIISSITAPGMFTIIFLFFCGYLPARLLRNLTFKEKNTREKFQKRSDKVQFGRWRDSFSSGLCSDRARSFNQLQRALYPNFIMKSFSALFINLLKF